MCMFDICVFGNAFGISVLLCCGEDWREVFVRSREREQAHQSERLLHRVGELDVLQVLAHNVRLLGAVRRLGRLTQQGVGQVTSLDLRIAGILVLAAVLDEGDFVVPPHDIAPVGLVVFLELGVELEVLADAHDDVLGRHAGVSLIAALVPLALAEVEGADAEGNIDDRALLSRLVLHLDAGQLSILIARHEQDAGLGKLLKKVAWGEIILIGEVGEGLLVAVDELELEGRDLELQVQALGLQVEQASNIVSTAHLPGAVRVIGATGLEHRHGGELQRRELDLTVAEGERGDLTSVVVAPLARLVLPDSDLDLGGLLAHVNVLGHLELDLNTNIGLHVRRRVREGNVAEALLNSQDRPHGPLCGSLALLRELVHLEVNDAADDEVVLDLVRREIVIARPERAQHNLRAGLLLRELAHVVAELDVVAVLVTREHVRPDTEKNVVAGRDQVQDVHAGLVTLTTALGVLLVLSDLLRGELRVDVHEFKDLRTDLVELLKLDVPQYINVLVAPGGHAVVVHSLRLAELVLHGADDVLSDLAHLHGVVHIIVWRLLPLRYERVQVSLAIDIRKRIARQRFRLFQNGNIR